MRQSSCPRCLLTLHGFFVEDLGNYLWGNGSSVTRHTSRGVRQLRESGNIGAPIVANERAIFISQDAVSSEVLSINLSTGLTGPPDASVILVIPKLRAQVAGW